jgi:hypothetical protein
MMTMTVSEMAKAKMTPTEATTIKLDGTETRTTIGAVMEKRTGAVTTRTTGRTLTTMKASIEGMRKRVAKAATTSEGIKKKRIIGMTTGKIGKTMKKTVKEAVMVTETTATMKRE